MATVLVYLEGTVSVLKNHHSEPLLARRLMNGRNTSFEPQQQKGFLQRSIVLHCIIFFP